MMVPAGKYVRVLVLVEVNLPGAPPPDPPTTGEVDAIGDGVSFVAVGNTVYFAPDSPSKVPSPEGTVFVHESLIAAKAV